MDIDSAPDVVFDLRRVGNACYRIARVDQGFVESKLRSWRPRKETLNNSKPQIEDEDEPVTAVFGVENSFAGVLEEDECNEKYEDKIYFSNGMWSIEYRLSHHFHKSAFGKGNHKLSSLGRTYDCSLKLTGVDTVRISSKLKISVILMMMYFDDKSNLGNLKFTHFVCIPLVGSKEVESNLKALHSQINDPLLQAALVPTFKLHFTLCMLKLPSPNHVEQVRMILKQFEGFTGNNQGVTVDLRGIQTMNEQSLEHMTVAYTGGVGGEGEGGWREVIGDLAAQIFSALDDAGLVDMRKQKSYFNGKGGKLHATIINAKYARRLLGEHADESSSDSDDEGLRKDWTPTDSRPTKAKHLNGVELIRRFKDFRFGQVRATQVRLCSIVERPGDASDPEGFYQTTQVVHI